jgi:hypothetical protein
VGAQRRPLKGMPDRHDNHLINVFFFNELTKSPVSRRTIPSSGIKTDLLM